ncbi:glycosyltransferase family 2 protein [Leucobacter luti]|uniref:GT2 family glycosyltransferase n=1 Tax=Leucobacter luti TaxID=340320 RepID=A0A4R6RQ50_9MICO|nr:glycosyltransferase family 2 protein [Leucobacter luti]QYM77000.1 glycosyltransferase family 2 protein [Leucobacter luti]TDP88911.1 GT2 family glycosyltransferase [Leucobacter luti]
MTDQNTPATLEEERRETVAAVIVTFNRVDKLPRTLESVLGQDYPCSTVVVINNASTDETREFLDATEDPRIVVRHLQENRGGAGGFEYGMALGHELGADYVWVMDDDCYPAPDALRILIEQRNAVAETLNKPVPFACSVVKAIDGALCEMNNPITTWDWPRAFLAGLNSMRVVECTFVSVLFPRYVLSEAGLPLAEYFIWFDDKEFTKRLSARYAPGIVAMDSIVIHDMGVNAGVNYREVTAANLWKFASGARNQSSYRWHFEGSGSYHAYRRRVLDQMRSARVPQSVQRHMREALKSGKSFAPVPKFPAELRDDLQLDVGRIADAPPAAIVPQPAVPFASNAKQVGPQRKRKSKKQSRLSRLVQRSRRQPVSPAQLHRLQVRINLLQSELDEYEAHGKTLDALVETLEAKLAPVNDALPTNGAASSVSK